MSGLPGAFLSPLIAVGLLLAAAAARAAPPPSLVLVTLDTVRADRIGAYGRANASTPNLDRLAASGVRFDAAWSAVPVTLPSHITLLTGCWPPAHGVRDNGVDRFDGRVPTLASTLAAKGYSTAAVVSAAVLDSVYGANRGFATYDDRFGGGERSAAAATDRALELARTLKPPYFLWVHYYDAHWPYLPPEPYAKKFASDAYQGEIAFVDSQLGRLLAGLPASAGAPLVAVAADHGEGLGEHRERTHGLFTYASTMRVPLILSGPGVASARVLRTAVSLADVAPTLLGLLGVPASGRADGVSLAPAVRAGTEPERRWLYYESLLPLNSFGWVPPRGTTDGVHAFVDLPKVELYDLRVDPGQLRNIAGGDPRTAGVRRRFTSLASEVASRAADASPAKIGTAERERLASLGYLSGLSSKGANPTLDPKDVVDLADKVDEAKGLRELGRHTDSLALADSILARNPENVPAASIRGQALLSLGRAREAAQTFIGILKRNAAIPVIQFDLGSSFLELGQVEEARRAFRKAAELEPRMPEPWASLIDLELREGDAPGALAVAAEAGKAGAIGPELSFEIGMANASAERYDAAETAFREAIRLRPGYGEALGNLAKLAWLRKRPAEAAELYRAAVAAGGGAEVRKPYGALLLDTGDPKGALEQFRAALASERDPAEKAQLAQLVRELEAALGTPR